MSMAAMKGSAKTYREEVLAAWEPTAREVGEEYVEVRIQLDLEDRH